MIDETENFAERVIEVIREWFKSSGFKDRKLTDTPTDDLQIPNKKYVDVHGGLTLVASDTTGGSTTLGTTEDFVTMSGLVIPVDAPLLIEIMYYRTVAVGTPTGTFAVQFNGTNVTSAHVVFPANANDGTGVMQIHVPPRNYVSGNGIVVTGTYTSDTSAITSGVVTSPTPNGTTFQAIINTIIISGSTSGNPGDSVLTVQAIRVWALPF